MTGHGLRSQSDRLVPHPSPMLTSAPPTTNAGAGINAGPVHCVENHDGAYRVWRDAGVTQRLLVHVDAHHDLYGRWIDRKNPKERSRINIANFVYAALEEELVRELIWVVPDQTWATPAGRRDIAHHRHRSRPPHTGLHRGKPAAAE